MWSKSFPFPPFGGFFGPMTAFTTRIEADVTPCDFQIWFIKSHAVVSLFSGTLTLGVPVHQVKCLSSLRLPCSPCEEAIFGSTSCHNQLSPAFQLSWPRDQMRETMLDPPDQPISQLSTTQALSMPH